MTLEHLTVVPDEQPLIIPPRGLVSLLNTAVRVRGDVALAVERGVTMSDLAATLASQARTATVTAREPNGTTWTISLGATETAEVIETAEAARP